jgi:cellulose biosynthesis protein BcsQ
MLSIVVTDTSTTKRTELVQVVEIALTEIASLAHVVPSLQLKPLQPQELKYQKNIDLLIVGPGMSTLDISEIVKLRRQFKDAYFIVCLEQERSQILLVELLARNGIEEVVFGFPHSSQLIQKVLFLSERKQSAVRRGQLVVVHGAKGGCGVSSIVAGLGEALVDACKKVVILDLDFDSQDLTRFLRVKPYVNEHLQLLLEGQRSVNEESVAETLLRVWQDVEGLHIVPPIPCVKFKMIEELSFMKLFMKYLEYLDLRADVVVVDVGSCHGVLLDNLFRVSDLVVGVVGNDPASLFASVDGFAKIRSLQADHAKLLLLEHQIARHGLASKTLRKEFGILSRLNFDQGTSWVNDPLRYDEKISRWPGSTMTPWSIAPRRCKKIFEVIIKKIFGDEGATTKISLLEKIFSPRKQQRNPEEELASQYPVLREVPLVTHERVELLAYEQQGLDGGTTQGQFAV